MFRLMIALGLAVALMPDNVSLGASSEQNTQVASVSTLDTLSAAQSLYDDVTSFCDRNEEACLTGKAIAGNIANHAKSAINSLTATTDGETQSVAPDEIITGSVASAS